MKFDYQGYEYELEEEIVAYIQSLEHYVQESVDMIVGLRVPGLRDEASHYDVSMDTTVDYDPFATRDTTHATRETCVDALAYIDPLAAEGGVGVKDNILNFKTREEDD